MILPIKQGCTGDPVSQKLQFYKMVFHLIFFTFSLRWSSHFFVNTKWHICWCYVKRSVWIHGTGAVPESFYTADWSVWSGRHHAVHALRTLSFIFPTGGLLVFFGIVFLEGFLYESKQGLIRLCLQDRSVWRWSFAMLWAWVLVLLASLSNSWSLHQKTGFRWFSFLYFKEVYIYSSINLNLKSSLFIWAISWNRELETESNLQVAMSENVCWTKLWTSNIFASYFVYLCKE